MPIPLKAKCFGRDTETPKKTGRLVERFVLNQFADFSFSVFLSRSFALSVQGNHQQAMVHEADIKGGGADCDVRSFLTSEYRFLIKKGRARVFAD